MLPFEFQPRKGKGCRDDHHHHQSGGHHRKEQRIQEEASQMRVLVLRIMILERQLIILHGQLRCIHLRSHFLIVFTGRFEAGHNHPVERKQHDNRPDGQRQIYRDLLQVPPGSLLL